MLMIEWLYNSIPAAVRRTLAAAVGASPAMALLVTGVLACISAGCGGAAGKAGNEDGLIQLAKPDGAINRTSVISASRRQDSTAHSESEHRLTETDWAALEKMGPRPVWEKLEAKRKRPTHAQKPGPLHGAAATRPAGGPKRALVLRPPGVPPTPVLPPS